MSFLTVSNPWNAPVYYYETVSSTMDAAYRLADQGEPHGTVAAADYQEAGRGRAGRLWNAERGKNLFFTLILRYPDIAAFPRALTLRAGLAVSLAVEDFAPGLAGAVLVKWPNDVMIDARKVAGVLTEAKGGAVFLGIGINVAQIAFPGDISAKAGSILQAVRNRGGPDPAAGRAVLLERILARLQEELASAGPWRERLEERLYLKGRRVRFIAGGADSGRAVDGVLAGIGAGGELLLIPGGGAAPEAWVTGELQAYQAPARPLASPPVPG
ncbi:MAG: biotin--[acetyl-CoA-carboxylase] ligase [Spirochaetaceae bacterium]|jgi:BirA family biotin operon repressor/biotin-[acetyl-CoA-carboxylase] ligase|nr:biotin--[acetyl-CoA-carboxylase] ligase [Spirochaetaceae bacterium]